MCYEQAIRSIKSLNMAKVMSTSPVDFHQLLPVHRKLLYLNSTSHLRTTGVVKLLCFFDLSGLTSRHTLQQENNFLQ